MEYNLSELKKKSVINVLDGKDLGKINDLVISFPDGRVVGIIVPGKKNSLFGGNELIVYFKCIEKIGGDAILVRLKDVPEPTQAPPIIEDNGEF